MKVTHAALTWWGFTTPTDRQRIDAVLRRANNSGLWTSAVPSDFPVFEDLCSTADDELFTKTSTLLHITCISPTTIHRITTIQPQKAFTLLSARLDTPPVFLTVISLPVCFPKLLLIFLYCLFLYIVYWLAFCRASARVTSDQNVTREYKSMNKTIREGRGQETDEG